MIHTPVDRTIGRSAGHGPVVSLAVRTVKRFTAAWRGWRRARAYARLGRTLNRYDDHLLADIGLRRERKYGDGLDHRMPWQ